MRAGIRDEAREMLVRAAERAASLAANEEAQHAYERAIELADDSVLQADLHERAGVMAQVGARPEEAGAHFEAAIALLNDAGETHAAARVEARLAEIMWDRGRRRRVSSAWTVRIRLCRRRSRTPTWRSSRRNSVASSSSRAGTTSRCERIESALELAEGLALPETFSQALNTKAILLVSHGRMLEGIALLRYALEVALENDKPTAALRAYFNLSDSLSNADRYEEAETTVRDGLAYARRIGNRYQELLFLAQSYSLFALGKWDDVLEWASALPEDWRNARQAYSTVGSIGVIVRVHTGRLDEARHWVELLDEFSTSSDAQERAAHRGRERAPLLAQGDPGEALRFAQVAIDSAVEMGINQEYVKEALVTGLEAALELRDTARVEALLSLIDEIPPGTPGAVPEGAGAAVPCRPGCARAGPGCGAAVQESLGALPRAGAPVQPRRHGARARRLARIARSGRGSRAAADRGERDLRTARR